MRWYSMGITKFTFSRVSSCLLQLCTFSSTAKWSCSCGFGRAGKKSYAIKCGSAVQRCFAEGCSPTEPSLHCSETHRSGRHFQKCQHGFTTEPRTDVLFSCSFHSDWYIESFLSLDCQYHGQSAPLDVCDVVSTAFRTLGLNVTSSPSSSMTSACPWPRQRWRAMTVMLVDCGSSRKASKADEGRHVVEESVPGMHSRQQISFWGPVINRVLSVTASSLASSSPLFFLLLNKFPLPLVFLCLLSSSLPFLQDLPSFYTTRCSHNPLRQNNTKHIFAELSIFARAIHATEVLHNKVFT